MSDLLVHSKNIYVIQTCAFARSASVQGYNGTNAHVYKGITVQVYTCESSMPGIW